METPFEIRSIKRLSHNSVLAVPFQVRPNDLSERSLGGVLELTRRNPAT
jgi:hypothetical protein